MSLQNFVLISLMGRKCHEVFSAHFVWKKTEYLLLFILAQKDAAQGVATRFRKMKKDDFSAQGERRLVAPKIVFCL